MLDKDSERCTQGWGWNPPVIIRFEGAILVEAHVLGLLVRELCQVGIKVW